MPTIAVATGCQPKNLLSAIMFAVFKSVRMFYSRGLFDPAGGMTPLALPTMV